MENITFETWSKKTIDENFSGKIADSAKTKPKTLPI